MYLFKTFTGESFGTAYSPKEVAVLHCFYAIPITAEPSGNVVVFRDDIDFLSFEWEDN